MNNKLKLAEFCAGTGSFSLASEKTNKIKTIFANDFDKNSEKIFNENFTIKLLCKDIHELNIQNDIPKHDILTAGFPCFIKGTKVLTNNGYKNIENVNLNDKLLTHNNRFNNILNIQTKHFSGDIYQININHRCEYICCTEEHPFLVKKKCMFLENPKWIKANKLTNDCYIGMPINKKNIIPTFIFNETLNFKLDKLQYWFILGYFISNGWINEMDEIYFTINDINILNEIKVIFPNIIKKNTNTYLCYDVLWLNIFKLFDKIKNIPEWIHNAPLYFIKHFLYGFNKSNNNMLTYELACGLQRLYLKIGYLISINKNTFNKYTYIICGLLSDFSDILYEDKYVWFNVNNINKIKNDDIYVYNFEVEHDNSYIVENSIVHNCQPFSIAGKQNGFNDERSNVFWNLIKIIKFHKPKIVIFENVKNLVSHDNGNTFTIITNEIKKLKYYYKYKILNTSIITNIPHNRERIYIICFKNKKHYDNFDFPESVNEIKNISDFIESNINKKYYYNDKLKIWNQVETNVKKDVSTNTIYQYRRYYIRENKNSVCPTLTANMGSGGHNVPLIKDIKGIRKLTPRECFNLQGFPTHYKFPKISDSALYKLAGNAISVPVIEKIMINIIKAIKN
jgi:DNA (cytosine-5)-methyltransferase 1